MSWLFSRASEQYLEGPAVITGYPLTMSAWLKWTEGETLTYVLSLADASETDQAFGMGMDTGTYKPYMLVYEGTAYTKTVDRPVTTDQWIHVCTVFWSATNRAIWADGNFRSVSTIAATPSGIDTFAIGRACDFSPGYYMQGPICEVALWDIPIWDYDVSQIYRNGPLSLKSARSNLRGYWPLNHKYGIRDLTGNHNLVAYNSPVWTGDQPERLDKNWLGVALDRRILANAPATAIGTPTWVSPTSGSNISSLPVLTFTMPSSASGNMHFHMQLDTADTFDTTNLRHYRTLMSQTGWEYWDDDSWEPFPSGGVSTIYCGNQARYTLQAGDELSETTWYRWIRGHIV